MDVMLGLVIRILPSSSKVQMTAMAISKGSHASKLGGGKHILNQLFRLFSIGL